jgi:uncharacterized low-complexity protein
MKKIVLAAAAALTLGMGVASAAQVQSSANGFDRLPSPAATYSPANG